MSKAVVMATWDDVPHLTAEDRHNLLESIPPYQRDARSKGVPQLGAGAIYPVPETDILVDPFDIPKFWPRSYGLDVGWKYTCAIFGAHDRETDTAYLYDIHYRTQADPSTHSTAIRARGKWMNGVVDPAARGRSQADGEQLIQKYRDSGLNLLIADNGVEAGLFEVWSRLSQGRLKVFRHLAEWKQEYRLYRRDVKGNIVKVNDHAMDATRYYCMSGIKVASLDPKYLTKLGHKSGMQSDYDPSDAA